MPGISKNRRPGQDQLYSVPGPEEGWPVENRHFTLAGDSSDRDRCLVMTLAPLLYEKPWHGLT